MLSKSRAKNKGQDGFTLYELLIALAITGIIAVAVTMLIIQLSSSYSLNTNHMTAVKQVENAVHSISRDAQMAQNVQPVGGSGFPLYLTWVEWDNTSNNVTYSIQNRTLLRAYSFNSSAPVITKVAQDINSNASASNCQFANDVLTFKITASIAGFKTATETREGKVIPRPR